MERQAQPCRSTVETVLVSCQWFHDAGREGEGTAGEARVRLASEQAAVSTEL